MPGFGKKEVAWSTSFFSPSMCRHNDSDRDIAISA